MGTFAQGREQVALMSIEATYGTQVKPVAGGGIRVLGLTINTDRERRYRADKRVTRSQQPGHFGRYTGDWELSKYLMTSGAKGTPPDDGDLWEALLGKHTNNASTSDVYEPDSTVDLNPIELYYLTGHYMEVGLGCAVNQAVIEWSGTDEPRVTFSGPLKTNGFAGTTTTNGTGSGSTALIVTDPYRFRVGGIIKIATDDNSGAGYLITAIDYATSTLTLGTAATWANGVAVAPFLPTPTTAGSAIAAGKTSMTIDTVALKTLSGRITINNQLTLINDEADSDAPSAITMPNTRLITFEIAAYLRQNYMDYLAKALEGVDGAFVISIGDTANDIIQIDIAKADYTLVSKEVPDTGEVRIALTGNAVQNAAGDDEIDVTYK